LLQASRLLKGIFAEPIAGLFQLGVMLSRKGDVKGATHHFSEVLRITPYSRKAQEKLTQLRSGSRTRR